MEIACKFKELKELEPALIREKDKRIKCGRYEGGNLNIKGFGYDKWGIAAYIIPDKPLKKYVAKGLTEQQIIEGCLRHLNKPPTKRSKKPKEAYLGTFIEGGPGGSNPTYRKYYKGMLD